MSKAKTKEPVLAPLLPCPFCGSAAEFYYTQYRGVGASGMEPPTVHAGCKNRCASFSGGETQGWDMARRWYDREQEAHDLAAEQWNRRTR